MRRTFKEVDILSSTRINESELLREVNLEISVLKGLDIFTNAHVQGVVKTTMAMCLKMNMPYEEIKKCVISAYLHDVGKIRIPPEILQKTARLTEEEYQEMKKHTVYGYEMCMEYPTFHKYASIVRAHHENLDGTGYPDGLTADEIPPEASLIKVADVYDALTQRRQYKDGYKQSEALAIMLNDVKAGKMSPDYYEILLFVVIEGLEEKHETHLMNIQKFNNNLEVLHELEIIYKQIYDRGLTPKLEKKLRQFELAPGYDMSTNANLLIIKQKSLEKELEWEKLCASEISAINKILKELYKWAD
ncbi:MAG: HD domain-containing protein [Clostridia bacterium]|nr:HD domain-containing protein [Clostridia bacterium]